MNIHQLPHLDLEAGLADVGSDDAITSVGGVVIGVITGIIAGVVSSEAVTE